jgi:hypothetical protein
VADLLALSSNNGSHRASGGDHWRMIAAGDGRSSELASDQIALPAPGAALGTAGGLDEHHVKVG